MLFSFALERDEESAMKQSAILEFESSSFAIVPGEDEETNPGIYGKELARWLAERLVAAGVAAEEPFAEDFGWCVPVDSKPHALHVACSSTEEGPNQWRVFAFAEGGLFARMLGKDKSGEELAKLFTAVCGCIESESSIRNVAVVER